jgi:hypothetical protein
MDAGSRGLEAGVKPYRRAVFVWMLIILFETLHGAIREIFIAPRLGDLHARQLGVLVGSAMVLALAWVSSRWIGATTRGARLGVGLLWVSLTLIFEFAVGRATGASWDRIFSDYNPLRGGLMLFGLAFMFIAPWLAARLRQTESRNTA